MTQFTKKKFTVGLTGKAYSDGWSAIFDKKPDHNHELGSCTECDEKTTEYFNDIAVKPEVLSLNEELHKLGMDRATFILNNREKFIEAWIAEHGHLPSKMELHESFNLDGSISTIVRLKS